MIRHFQTNSTQENPQKKRLYLPYSQMVGPLKGALTVICGLDLMITEPEDAVMLDIHFLRC